uniref:C2H2-type domain-containing protein n=1 Tax=Rhodosorus marinus TaxID=101924 RepID=A0A7S3A8K3_9RHOD|mmetsp:Transcript_7256/g.32154  ORF Transcript_7256/g.32154 Transcript_7256/m.32154 type:complete len:452 (+) Transcript_7256:199-1554(+)
MSFSELFPVADEVLKDFLLHKSDVKVFDFNSADAMMFSMKVLLHEEVMKSPFYGLLRALTTPVFMLSTKYCEDVRIGMGWIFENSGPLLQYPSDEGVVHGVRQPVTTERICVFKHNGRAHLICTHPGDDNGIPFYHLEEVSMQKNCNEVGVLDRETGDKFFSVTELATRPCVICCARGEGCSCSEVMMSRGFGPMPMGMEDRTMETLDFSDEAFAIASRQWMSGRFGFHSNGLPTFSINARILSSGDLFNSAKVYLVQQQIQQSTGLRPPVSRSPLERSIFSMMTRKPLKKNVWTYVESAAFLTDSIPSTDAETSEKLVDRERLKCDQCDASFGSRWGLRRHVAGVHEKSRNFTCKFCARTFKQSGHLHEHMSVYHSESGGHDCEICGKRFGVKSKLDRHVIQKHTNVNGLSARFAGGSTKTNMGSMHIGNRSTLGKRNKGRAGKEIDRRT